MSPTSEMDSATRNLADRLRGRVVAAVATPMTVGGDLHVSGLEQYAAGFAGAGLGGAAVWAHTGRGLHLRDADRARVLATFRASVDGVLIAGAGVPSRSGARAPAEQVAATVGMAEHAAELGADAVMVYPCPVFRDDPQRDALIVRLHEEVARAAGLPLIGFWLHEAAGGYPYSPRVLAELMAMPTMCGLKLATLDRAIACQDAIAAIHAAGRLAITGEDRMFGPSLMWGADSALVGIAAAVPHLSVDVVSRWVQADAAGFLAASRTLDTFAEVTFKEPIEGYVQRMLWAAAREGRLPERGAHDPWAPPLPRGERDAVMSYLAESARVR